MHPSTPDVSLPRLYLLRAMYLLIVVGLSLVLWPGIISHAKPWTLSGGVVNCMLAAFSLLALLGLRYPLQMLPILMWEFIWKAIWMGLVAYPAWSAGTIDEATMGTAIECMVAILIPIVMPWGYVLKQYVRAPAARWR
ncbi:hypothetical protein [Massilia sp. CF038]|uniref:hypothetical protein n=1 Tax=Massilia sp. CF038 TaxID=1881045 RepID=UPI00091589DC|nr:hypothetical protein [Massilia sp. CF038]SHG47763.1 hypothetical protein SAMN05428948_0652 [Massilia sp. CF038]